ncbi:anthranilate synthase component I [Desulfotruncus alcoholivorax]|uniref:anthranilate synthase component I n=1 Tax=Desulfotruncus alcoholivorax TaxID=265477 RepID=UPI0004243377|nr:anthranilate synthase component I [Desulfotruncus alcoholivorax]
MVYPELNEYHELSRNYNLIPVYTEKVMDTETPITLFLKLSGNGPCCLLESVEGGSHLGRYSFIAMDPLVTFCSKNGKGEAAFQDGSVVADGPPLEALTELLGHYRVPLIKTLPRFYGGAVGYLAYDAVRFIEKLPGTPADKLELPDCMQFVPGTVVIYDHVRHTVTFVVNMPVDAQNPAASYSRAIDKLEEIDQKLLDPLPAPKEFTLNGAVKVDLPDEALTRRIGRALEYIRAGDIIQVVLSRRYSVGFKGDAFAVYRRLRSVNPSPYMFYFNFGEIKIVGSSPEMLIRAENGVVTTCPIAGTRPRGKTPEEDSRLAAELLEDEKERAEHLMLVDLGRNDLGRVCLPGSVKVPRFMDIEYFSHVMHIVSRVEGVPKPGVGALDALKACFPAGTVSGAPKVRAMEIIDELEPTRRGIYAGSAGYLGFNGNLDTAIAIRTLVIKDDTAYIQAGAGIVADSNPRSECEEMARKADAMFKTLGLEN